MPDGCDRCAAGDDLRDDDENGVPDDCQPPAAVEATGTACGQAACDGDGHDTATVNGAALNADQSDDASDHGSPAAHDAAGPKDDATLDDDDAAREHGAAATAVIPGDDGSDADPSEGGMTAAAQLGSADCSVGHAGQRDATSFLWLLVAGCGLLARRATRPRAQDARRGCVRGRARSADVR